MGRMLIRGLLYRLRTFVTLFHSLRDKRAFLWSLLSELGGNLPAVELGDSGLKFQVRNFHDVWVIKEVCLDQCYLNPNLEMVHNPVIIDIGACLGAFAVDAGSRYPKGRIYAYEPFLPSYELLNRNIGMNHLPNVSAFPYAVAGLPGNRKLYLNSRYPMLHSMVPSDQTGPQTAVEIRATSLDSIMADNAIDRCDILKIDCEGSEFEIVLEASDETLERIRFVSLEYHDGVTALAHGDLVRFLADRGFDVAVRANPVHSWLGNLYAFNTAFA